MPSSSRPNPAKSAARAVQLFRRAGGTLRARAAHRAGIHSRTLHDMHAAGTLHRISRGVYRLADIAPASQPDLVVLAHRVPSAVVCLVSALAFHRLTTQIPRRVDIAIDRTARTPRLSHPPLHVYRFGGMSLKAGVERHMIDGAPVHVFSAAKTVADCFKFRNRVGIDVAIESLRTYLRRPGGSVDTLIRFAEVDRVKKVLMPYIEATL